MINQRWRQHRSMYRPAGEVINPAFYEVDQLPGDDQAKSFVQDHHYSRSYPAARYRFALYERGILAGVAVFSHPCNDRALTNVFRCQALDAVELGRFVLLDSVPGNGETWFLARCFQLLKREQLIGVVSFSDPLPRRNVAGEVVHPGHVGTIYQAFSARYLGRSKARTLRLLPDGSVLSDRAIQKIRRQERGWRYAAALLEKFGATTLDGDPVVWLSGWLPRITRAARHPGNHRYAWPLQATTAKTMPASLPYPKQMPALLEAAL